MAAGLGNDLLTTLALVTRAPMLLAPAMNVHMWEHPLTQANLTRLRLTGRLHTVGPGHGILACGDVGPGRMADPALIVEAGARLLERQDLRGRRVLVTAGPTQEPLDPVRYLGNRSSGKMGFAVARSAHLRGAQVTLVTGPTSAAPPPDLDVIRVGTAAEMEAAVSARYDSVDVIVMTAAVADFRPAEPADGKLKKDALGADPVVRLARNPDILAGLGRRRQAAGGGPLLVGFAAETGDAVAEARRKLAEKGCDLIVANDVCEPGAGFGQDTNKVSFVGPASVPPRSGASPAPIVVEDLPLLTKEEVAHRLWDRILQLGGGA
jgi:phosphopantothenoylcysteine decarboxylase/phosphopantothenate--cysteine ligase